MWLWCRFLSVYYDVPALANVIQRVSGWLFEVNLPDILLACVVGLSVLGAVAFIVNNGNVAMIEGIGNVHDRLVNQPEQPTAKVFVAYQVESLVRIVVTKTHMPFPSPIAFVSLIEPSAQGSPIGKHFFNVVQVHDIFLLFAISFSRRTSFQPNVSACNCILNI